MTTGELSAILGLVGTIVVGTITIETRYAKQADVDRGHMIAELNAKLYTINKEIADLTGRSLMYQLKAESGEITSQETVRWDAVRTQLESQVQESAQLQADVRELIR